VTYVHIAVYILAVNLIFGVSGFAQSAPQASPAQASPTTVPLLVRTRGVVLDESGKPLTGNIGITFTVYKDEFRQKPVWQESQNVKLDSGGRYNVLLGSESESGIPLAIFSAGEARWLGVRPHGLPEQPLIVLLSVPYALKAADSDMLGGMPASAFALATPLSSSTSSQLNASSNQVSLRSSSQALGPLPGSPCSAVTSDGTGTANELAKFTTPCSIQNSAIFESGGNVGIGTTTPAGVLDVNGPAFVRGTLDVSQGAFLEPVQTATTSQGYASGPFDLAASVYNTSVSSPVDYLFRWQSTPIGNNTANPSAALSLLYGVPGLVSSTGFSIANNGIITFAPGQTFPGASGTVTSVATGAGLAGGPITKSGTISIPNAGVTNAMLANPSLTVTAGSGLSGGGTVALGGTITLTNAAPSSGGTVTSIATGAGLSGGPITKTGTISIPDAAVSNAMLANPSVTVNAGSGLSGGGTVALGGTITLTNAAPGSGGTVTSVTTGAGLTGGPITKTGTISIPAAGVTNTMLANPSLTVQAGSGLSGGGTVALGGTVTLNANLAGTTNGIGYFSAPTVLTSTAAPTNGQILIGSTGKSPVLSTLTAGQNVTITHGPGSITIAAQSGSAPALPFFVTGDGRVGFAQGALKNVTTLWGFLLPYSVTTTQITYDLSNADNTANNYDIGVYGNDGTLVVDVGAIPGTTFAPSTGFRTLAWTQGSTVLNPGRYYIGFTTNCSTQCAKVAAAGNNMSFAVGASSGASVGGTLPSTITPPADSWNTGVQPTVVIR